MTPLTFKHLLGWWKSALAAESQSRAEYQAKWQRANPGYAAASAAKWNRANPEKAVAKSAKWQRANPEYQVKWRQENREKITASVVKYQKERCARDCNYKLLRTLRCRLAKALRGIGVKSAHTRELLGCSVDQLRPHLENQFRPGMTWENHGTHGWHVDHIKPCASFDLTQPEQQRACFHFTNLQPLWAVDNLQKSDKLK